MKKIKSLYVQIAFVLLAFITMVTLSYHFSSRMVYGHIVDRAENIIEAEQLAVESVINDSKLVLGIFSDTVKNMIVQGYDFASLERYIQGFCEFLMENSVRTQDFGFVYGYVETLTGERGFISGDADWIPEADYVPQNRPWYDAALKAKGAVAADDPYTDARTDELVYTFSRALYNDDGLFLGVVAVDVPLQIVADTVVSTALAYGGYGMLASSDFKILSHPNLKFVDEYMTDESFPAHAITDELEREGRVFEYPMLSYRNEESIAFFQRLSNGWYLGFITPQEQYYNDVTTMATTLIIIGAFLALALIIVLIQIDRRRERADFENKQKSAFLANMSHEIRTPMNAIIGMTMIGKSTDDVSRMTYCFEKIENASQHLLGVINDILDMSKIEANKFELSEQEFDFEKMLQRVVNIAGFRAAERKQELSVFIDKSIPRNLIGDDQRLAQVITNLLGNAVKFTPEGGSIKVDCKFIEKKADTYTIRVTVSDTGIGIAPEHQNRLWGSFQQADSNTTRKFGGTGLGLTISKSLVQMMGGRIEVESEVGKGSAFSFTFEARRTEKKSPCLSEIGVNWQNVSIMAVDDDKDILAYFAQVMQSFGTFCDTAISGEQALALIDRKGMYDIFFIDWRMPEMDGLELAQAIKAKSQKPDNTVVVMISSAEWCNIADEAKEAGVDRFLSKPLFPSAIADAITEVIGAHRQNIAAEPQFESLSLDGAFKNKRILLAEDVEVNREILMALLESTEVTIKCAEDGLQAVEKFTASPKDYFDLIFMDIQMPNMDGHQATREIRKSSHANAETIPIIAMTANVFKGDIQRSHEAGMNSHIGKPVDIEELFGVLRKFLK